VGSHDLSSEGIVRAALRLIERQQPVTLAEQVGTRCPAPLYYSDQVNRCPGCWGTNWHVGRLTAECGFCGYPMALAEAGSATFQEGNPK
jgi:hypothetical protein